MNFTAENCNLNANRRKLYSRHRMVAAYVKGESTCNLKIRRIVSLKSNGSIEYYPKTV